MIPIRDDNPTRGPTPVTIALIVLNVLVFLIELGQGGDGMESFIWKYGYVPAELTAGREEFRDELPGHAPVVERVTRFGWVVPVREAVPVRAAAALPAWLNIFTCMFLHGGWAHLLGNMLYLWIFGNNIEDRLGPALYLVFYVGTGVVGNLTHTFFDLSWAPLVGASGAISGVMGAYIVLFPHARIQSIVPAWFYWFTISLPAWVFLGVYVLLQNLFPAFSGAQGSVAYWAHIGGFASGVGLIFVFPKRPAVLVVRRVAAAEDDSDFAF